MVCQVSDCGQDPDTDHCRDSSLIVTLFGMFEIQSLVLDSGLNHRFSAGNPAASAVPAFHLRLEECLQMPLFKGKIK